MNQSIFLLIFFALGAIYFLVGYFSRKNIKTRQDYYVANRSLGVFQITSNLIATQIGGGFILGSGAMAYSDGLAGFFYSAGIVVGFLLLSLGVASRLQQYKVITTAEIFQVYYRSDFLQSLASVLSMVTLFGILVAQAVGFKSLIFSMGFSNWVFVSFWLLVVIYTMLGGMKAITNNDMVQLLVIVVVFGGLFVSSLTQEQASLSILFNVTQYNGLKESLSRTSLVSVLIAPALFSLMEQDLAQRFFAARTKQVASGSALVAGVFLLGFSVVPVYFGVLAKTVLPSIPPEMNPVLVFLQQNTSQVIYSFAICAVCAAIVSTADALINGVGAHLNTDFSWKLSKNSELIFAKGSSLLIGTVALIASYFVPQSVLSVIINSYEISVSGLLAPLLAALFRWPCGKGAAFFSAFMGLSSYGVLTWMGDSSWKVVLAFGGGLFGLFVGWGYEKLNFLISEGKDSC
jgi:SSS family solute:Na+ symporter